MDTRDYPVVESPDFLLAALERANDAVVIVDADLRVSYFNAAAERMWGQDRAEVLGRDVGHLGLGDCDDAPQKPAQEHRSEIAIARRDGSRIRAALSLSSVELGGQSRTIAFVRDITAEIERDYPDLSWGQDRDAVFADVVNQLTPRATKKSENGW